MSTQVDEAAVRKFIEIISAHATQVINGANQTGVLQLSRIHPADEKKIVPSRFNINDIDEMVKTAIGDAAAGHNVYIEARTVRADLNGNQRGTAEDTAWVFGFVADCDADKGKGGNIAVRPSLAIETSPGNYHLWYLLNRAIPAGQAKPIGDAIRASSGTDQDTGVITQCYRVPGTPNFPNTSKRARGRTTVEPTRILEHTGRLWDPDELLAAFPAVATSPNLGTASGADGDEATLPDDLLKVIRNGDERSVPDRSQLFHNVIGQLKKRRWSVDAIVALLEKYPNGIAEKYDKRLRQEVERSYDKIAGAVVGPSAGAGASAAGPSAGAGATGPSAGTTAPIGGAPGVGTAPGAAAAPHVIPTIRVLPGQLPRAVAETECALLGAGMPVFSRAGTLVHPVSEDVFATNERKTVTAKFRAFCTDSLLEWVAEAALFQRYDNKRKAWVDIDPPLQLVRMALREGRWAIPRVGGIITTPTLRADGSILATPGYDPRSELYLLPGLQLPPIPERPTREEARAALDRLIELFAEFSFAQPLDRAVAVSGLLTAQVRGLLPTAPIYLVRAHTPGTGKSYLVDVISMVTTGRICPVITASKSEEETEKRFGAVLLSGSPIVSVDNCIHDLGGELLCQLSERPLVRIRILGRSEMPECECRTAVFATGNNIVLKGDMVRRGLVCNLEALTERPELREFQNDALERAAADRGAYVAAALTIIRAYLTAGSPQVCGAFGSYAAWSNMVRSPLIWLGEPDPISCMDLAREQDPELSDIRELFDLWLAYLDLDEPLTTSRIIEIACATPAPNDLNPPVFKEFLARVAGYKGEISSIKLGLWLRKISGRVVKGYRLVLGRKRSVASFWLQKILDSSNVGVAES